ncbi:MAG: hypothetical protein E7463_10525 [Ruminococcaceae bacterium]|nr:hypothetical protein [Oscillospiraceae bacterium]
MEKNTVFKRFSEESFRLINQTGVSHVHPAAEGNETFNCNWDGAVAPDGYFYFTLSSENGRCDHAKLMRWKKGMPEMEQCFYSADYVIPQERHIPHSKLHTSINFIPADNPSGYQVIAATHSTDRAKQHTEWMPFGHHNDIWEGFPGSHVLIWDPDSRHVQDLGVPVPRESIYGAVYDPKHHRLYMVGFMRGHIYSFDLTTKKVIDLGRGMEFCSYRLSLGGDGNVYGGSKAGYFFRVNTETQKLEQLPWELPDYPGNYINNTWYRWMSLARPHPSGKFMYMLTPCSDHLWRVDYETMEVAPAGGILPKDGIVELQSPESCFATYTFAIDKDGVIWYAMRGWAMKSRLDFVYWVPCYLCRWDIDAGREPEVLGIIGTMDNVQTLTCEMDYDEKNDILYCCNVGRGFAEKGPDVIAIELSKFREHMYEPGPVSSDPLIHRRDLTEEEKRARDERLKKYVGEEVTANNPYQPVPDADCYPLRLWRSISDANIDEAAVIGMAWDDKDILHVVTGSSGTMDAPKYVLRVRNRTVIGRMDWEDLGESYQTWLRENVLPGKPDELPANIMLPEATGRRYRATASATAKWHDGRTFVGTQDAMCALVSDDGRVYALGNAAAYGPIRCITTNKTKTKLWGVAGDVEDMGYLFTYDDEEGLRQMGIISYNAHGFYKTTQANVLTSVAISPDEKTLAVGSADRMADVHLITLEK